MNRKFKDLYLALSSSRKAQFFLGLGLLIVLFLKMAPSGPSGAGRARQQAQAPRPDTGRPNADEASEDLLRRFSATIDDLQNKQRELNDTIGKIQEKEEEDRQRTAEIFRKLIERSAQSQGSGQDSIPVPAEVSDDSALNTVSTSPDAIEESMESFGPLKEPDVAPPAPPAEKKVAFIGAGDSVRIKLLAGVNAPTDGTPYPVLFKVIGDVYGPDGSSLPLGEARLIAAAQGSLTDSRALFRLTSMNIRLPSGERKVVNVDGWVVGEDGIRGMQGILIDPIGQAIGGAAVAGGLQGLAQGFQASRTSVTRAQREVVGPNGNLITVTDPDGGFATSVTGNVGEYAAATGLSYGAREWANIIRDRLRELVPVVQVYSDREGTAVFAKSVKIENLYDELANSEEGLTGLD